MRPNILWIVLDTARADALEPYGAATGSTPAIADLASRGRAVEGVHSTACWTLPSHASMLAGGLPRALGLANQAGIRPHSAKPIIEALTDRLLPEVLRRTGYRTRGVSANAWVSPQSGFGAGFERFEDARIRRQARMSSQKRTDRIKWLAEAARASGDDGAADAERIVRGWIDERSGDPFFWFVNLVECHSPYLPPKPYADGLTRRVRAAAEASRYLTQANFWRACVTGEVPDAEALERMRAGYRGAVRYMDDWLARLLERLEAAGALDDTLVIVTSDHGENFGEGDLIGHGFSLDQRLIGLPFVAAGPGAERLEGVRSLAEVPAIVAELAGVADHPYRDELPPLAVAQFDPPAPPPEHPRTAALVEDWSLSDAMVARLTQPQTAAVDGSLKLVERWDGQSFYDLAADPLEERPLAAADVDAAAAGRLRAALAHPAATASHGRDDFLVDQPVVAPEDPELTDLEERMRLLGYL